ncbi:unnamed protein product [Rhizophagus irregularis]|nr:unnamed protein product [Rhizophagus irregularis]
MIQADDDDDPGLAILKLVSTRWLSLSQTVSNLHQTLNSIISSLQTDILVNDDGADLAKKLLEELDPNFILATKFLADLFDVLQRLIKAFQGDFITLSDVHYHLNSTILAIQTMFIGDDNTPPTYEKHLLEYIESNNLSISSIPNSFSQFSSSIIQNIEKRFPDSDFHYSMRIFDAQQLPLTQTLINQYGEKEIEIVGEFYDVLLKFQLLLLQVLMATKGKKREKIPDWVQYMQACSPALKIFKRANGGYMLRDTFRPLEVLSIHAELQTNRNYCFNPYYHAITKKENIPTPPWVPLLPDHCVIGKFGSLYVRLEIQSNNEEHLIYCWKIYKNMEMTQLIHWEANSDFFIEATLALAVEYEALKKLENSSRKRIKRAKTNNEYIKNLKYKLHEEKDQELLNNWIRKTLEETNIGSTIFVNTEQYLTSIYTQPCLTCHNRDLSKKKLDVHRTSYNIQVKIKCKICQGITEYSNESPNA